jgi:hypothetical protein
MAGVFHSMLTQGHVSINRFVSTVHSYLGLFRSHGQRVFVEFGGGWQLLDVPSAFEMAPTACRWIYRHAQGVIEVCSEANSDPDEMLLRIEVRSGAPVRCLISHHIALDGDDGSGSEVARWSRDDAGITVLPAADSELGRRFPQGSFHIAAMAGTAFEHVGGDELLFLDGQSRQQPYLCVVTAPGASIGLHLRGRLVSESAAPEKQEVDDVGGGSTGNRGARGESAGERRDAAGRHHAVVRPRCTGSLSFAARSGAVFRWWLGYA